MSYPVLQQMPPASPPAQPKSRVGMMAQLRVCANTICCTCFSVILSRKRRQQKAAKGQAPGATVVSTGGGIQSWMDLRRELDQQHGPGPSPKDKQAAKYAMKKQYDRFLTQEALKTLSRVQDQWHELDAHVAELKGVTDTLEKRIQVCPHPYLVNAMCDRPCCKCILRLHIKTQQTQPL